MKLHRFLPLLGLLLCSTAPDASAQSIMLRGGPSMLTNSSSPDAPSGAVSGYGALGARLWLTDLFQLQASAAYDSRLSLEAELLFRPFARDLRIEPYAFIGVGAQFEGEDQRGIVPAGLGLEYHATERVGVFFEMAGRWQSRRNPALALDALDFHMAPTFGVTLDFIRRPDGGPRGSREVVEVAPEVPAPVEVAAAAEPAAPASVATAPAASPSHPSAFGRMMGGDVVDDGTRIRVPDGTFVMGLTDEDPLALQTAGIKRITVSAFYIDKHEVSNGAYRTWMEGAGGGDMAPDPAAWQRAGSTTSFESYFESGAFDAHPVVAVTWDQAQAYCEAQDGRLPTEAEWEYAARSGMPGGIYPWLGFETRDESGRYLANFSPGRAVYAADGHAFTAPAEAFPPSPWGLYHLSGNAAEWVFDAFSPSYAALSDFNPRYESDTEALRVVRGGSWASDDFYIGVGVRDAQPADEATIFTGFRCAYDAGALDGQAQAAQPVPAEVPVAAPADAEAAVEDEN